jgi:hypothetical protein
MLNGAMSRLSLDSREDQLLLLGRIAAQSFADTKQITKLSEVEFKVFSQFGDDGIIQWLIRNVEVPNTTFVEFGVEDYRESNTRFLLMNNNWAGLVIDGSPRNIAAIRSWSEFWKYGLTAKAAFLDRNNINDILSAGCTNPNIGLLSIDIDGNDYWVWEAINVIDPIIVIIEYNSVFGGERAITIPYNAGFRRARAHCSWLYFGASLAALAALSARKGYALIGSNGAGNNAYFIRRDHLNSRVREVSPAEAFVESRFRESRDASGRLNYLDGAKRYAAIGGLPVVNVRENRTEPL